MRVLSLPTCLGWLRRQANDASYDFWPDLSIGAGLVRERRSRAAPCATKIQAVFIMHKDHGGEWDIDRWHADEAVAVRPVAANGSTPESTGKLAQLPRQRREQGLGVAAARDVAAAPSFIIEIGGVINV